MRIFVADDHAVVREGLKRLLATAGDMEVTGEASTGAETLTKLRAGVFDVLVLDVSMPERNGLEVLEELRARGPRVPVLVLSISSEEQFAIRSIEAGASGYLTKASVAAELIQAVRTVGRGEKYITREVAQQLAERRTPRAAEPYDTLSAREREVFRRLAAGMPLKAIAAELHVSEKTITSHRRNILDKLRLDNNAELVRFAVARRLVDE